MIALRHFFRWFLFEIWMTGLEWNGFAFIVFCYGVWSRTETLYISRLKEITYKKLLGEEIIMISWQFNYNL